MEGVTRRAFLGGALAVGAGGVLVACGSDGSRDATADAHEPASPPSAVALHGPHQAGILTPAPSAAAMLALDARAPGAAELADGFRVLSREVRALTREGGPGPDGEPGAVNVVASVGASLFDERYGLGSRAPTELEPMPGFANDALDPDRVHGDVLLTVSADHEAARDAATARLLEAAGAAFGSRWTLTGGNERERPGAHPRNAMGFHDGTANPDPGQGGVMRLVVWVQARDDEPDWTAGGSYHAVRVIRMDLDAWEQVDVTEQEQVIGRRKDSGAPLEGGTVDDVPDFRDDPDGAVTPLDAHIRLANPRDRGTEYDEILRRGFTYDRGPDADGRADVGLAFVSFQRSLRRGFLAIQARLDGEPLERFTTTEGGGFYFALPGMLDEDDWLARPLLAGI